MSILDLSETLTRYDFHYNYIKNRYSKKAKLLCTDTDSLCYEIETKNVYRDFWVAKEKFYNSDYPKDSKFYDESDKEVIGKFKDEAATYIKDKDHNHKTAKGIRKNAIKQDLKHSDYKNTLLNSQQMYHKMRTIRSDCYHLGSCEINEVSL